MLHSFKKILNTTLHATDGEIGHLDDLLFDDQLWIVRYVVVRTGVFLKRHRVLISPLGVAQVDWDNQALRLHLTRRQIEESPDVDTDQPLFRQMEKRYFDYYSWPYYWSEMSIWGIDPRNSIMSGEVEEPTTGVSREAGPEEAREEPEGDPHLRSFREVSRYSFDAEETTFGQVADLLIEDDDWTVRYLVAETRTWWPSQRLLISPSWIRKIDWGDRCIKLRLTKDEIEASPEFSRRSGEARPSL